MLKILLIAVNLYCASANDAKIFTPYFNMSLKEGGYIPSSGNIFTGSDIDSNAGVLFKLARDHNLLFLYNFDYSGPGFEPQDTKTFSQREMAHNLNVEYRYQLSEKLRLRPGYSLYRKYVRMGGNESWDNGLYNSKGNGFQFFMDYGFRKESTITASLLYRKIEFPNYTDLLYEFQSSSLNSEISGGMYDQNVIQYSVKHKYKFLSYGFSYIKQNYDKQKVLNSDLTYSNSKQKDSEYIFDIQSEGKYRNLEISPSITYLKHNSNQNFVRYKSITDTSPQFIEDAYSYKDISFNLPLSIKLSDKWFLNSSLSILKRYYVSRPPRDINNDYLLTEKQNNSLYTTFISFKKSINEIASVSLYYAFTSASSNNKFEVYMPYNYTGNSFGLIYNISY